MLSNALAQSNARRTKRLSLLAKAWYKWRLAMKRAVTSAPFLKPNKKCQSLESNCEFQNMESILMARNLFKAMIANHLYPALSDDIDL